ncbi:hypothetical protein CDAR_257931 [Caerostris darwini]|uniref:Cux N-terminal domain-containing protein n=1 Tax=Caerostris darwini TaxID=1538125 RepID=A0AAV4WWD8_9ARAC|nr:hypothetical protein CDAR_257931 [Caerostris darwini]
MAVSDIRKAVVPLLKSFQAEVDSLSKRSKAAEAAFLTIYRTFIELPVRANVFDWQFLGLNLFRSNQIERHNVKQRDRQQAADNQRSDNQRNRCGPQRPVTIAARSGRGGVSDRYQ